MVYERKIINDPVFGFINIPKGLLYDIVRHPLLQRLTRIKQVGLSSVVYPGAQHTRFQHSLGAFYLMSEAITQLASKGNFIFDSEAEAVQAAILLHDIGHGPFSHVLEDTIVKGIPHEEISLMLMERMNKEMNGQLSLAIQIFKDEYPKRFLHQLVSGQLDMDRLDYLRRDSFYTGVTEGNIGSARIIKMLDVADDRLVVESKGIYSIENFLTARRLMYWQVYLHKTSVAYEKMLISTLLRAKELASQGIELFASPALRFFLYNDITPTEFYSNPDCLENFIQLDDNDIWTALKVWSTHTDKVLSTLSMGMINRNIFKVEISSEPISEDRKKELTLQISQQLDIPLSEANYFVSTPSIEKNMYDPADDSIDIIYNDGTIKNIAEASDMLNISLLSKKVKKYYLQGEIIGDENATVHTFAKIEEGMPGAISFLSNPKYTPYIYETQSSIVLVNKDFTPEHEIKATLIKVDNAYESLAKLLNLYEMSKPKKEGIDSLAFVAPSAKIGENVYIGAFAYIGENAVIGDNTQIYPHTFVGDGVKIGKGCLLYSNVNVYHDCRIGNECILHSGAVIGADGFGFAPTPNGYDKIPQIGIVILEDKVDIGANTCVDRATMGATVIHSGAKIDNLVQIAHNDEVGSHTVMAAQVGIAGSTKIGEWCMFGGQVGIAGHIKIGDRVNLGAQSGVPSSIKSDNQLIGTPPMELKPYFKAAIVTKKLPDMYTELNKLRKEVEELKQLLNK